jgi:hypothetical protein
MRWQMLWVAAGLMLLTVSWRPDPAAASGPLRSADAADAQSAAQSRPYSGAAIWQWNDHRAELEAWCDQAMYELDPDARPEDRECIQQAMRQTGATPEAIRFFRFTQMFLISFEPLGVVDLGTASAPWLNMGRGHLYFINGSPEAVSIFTVTPEDWETDPSYSALLAGAPRFSPFPWPGYARPTANANLDDGGQRVRIEYPMQECRACPVAVYMPVLFTFDPQGRLTGARVLPPTSP